MRTKTPPWCTEAAIWMRVIHPNGELSPRVARAILKLEFDPADQQRMHELALKANSGALTAEEEAETDNYERVGTTLAILKSKARQLLKKKASRT